MVWRKIGWAIHVAGQTVRGQITHPGYEHVIWQAMIQKIEPEKLFSFTWHPYAMDPNIDYARGTADSC